MKKKGGKKSKNKLTKPLLALLIGASMTQIAFAGSQEYTAYRLPRLKVNNYTNTHVKVTRDRYIKNKVTDISGTTHANFWVVDENNRAQSKKYKQNVSNVATKINYNNSSTLDIGQNIKMAMENANYSTGYAFVSGEVDFR